MIDWNGFDKGVIGKKLPSDTTLNNMRKADLIKLLHLAESNHRTLAETYKIAIDTSKCKSCPLSIDTRRAEQIRADAIDDITEKYFDAIEEILHDKELKLELNQALTIYARIMNKCGFIAEQLKEQKNE